MPIVLIIAAAASYGLVTPLVKLAVRHDISVDWITFTQYPLPLMAFLVMTVTRRKNRPRPLIPQPGLVLAVGAAGAATSITYYRSLSLLAPGLAVVLLFQFAWMAPLLEWLLYKKQPQWPQIAGILAIVVGTLLAIPLGHGKISPLGVVWGASAGLFYALTLVWSSHFPQGADPWPRALISTAAALTIVSAIYLMGNIVAISKEAWIWGAAVGIFSQGIPLWLLYRNAPLLGASLTAILASAELPVAVAGSALLVGEPIIGVQWLGIALMIGGIVEGSISKPST